MYKFIIGDKEFNIGKLCLSNSSILAYEDQSILRLLDGVSVLSYEIQDHIKTLVKNNALNHWSFKETLGTIAFNLSIAAATKEERIAKLNKVKSMLADESVIQIKGPTINEYHKGILLLGNIDETLETDSFNIIYGFKKDDGGIGLYPLAPSFIKTMLNGKNLTITFKKGANSVSTKFVVNGTEYSTLEETITIPLAEYETKYSVEIYSVSADAIVGDVTVKTLTTPKEIIIPTIPTNVSIVAVIGKYVTLSFLKGTNAYKTEITLGDVVTETFEKEVTILMGAFNKTYDLKLRSVSSNGGYSDYTPVIQVTTLEPIVPSIPTITDVQINEDVVTFIFTKGKDAISTEFIVDGVLYTTQESSLVVDIGAYNKTFTYKARSLSYTETYSEYTTEGSATTHIVPSLPKDITVSMNGKVATFSFVKATDAVSTEFIVDEISRVTNDSTLIVEIDAYSKTFAYKARSLSSTGDYSAYTTEANATTGIEPIIPTVPTNITVSIAGTVATFSLTKGTNAISTELVVDGTAHSTSGTSLIVDIGTYSKTFAYKARSLSSTGNYSAYTTEANATTQARILENVLLAKPAIKNNSNYMNLVDVYSPKDYVNGAEIEINELVAMNANRYSVGASVINGTLVER